MFGRLTLLVFGLLLLQACSNPAPSPVSDATASEETPASTILPSVPPDGSEQASDDPGENPQPAEPVPEIQWQRAVVEGDAEYVGVAAFETGFVTVDRLGRVLVSGDGLIWEEIAAGQEAFATEGWLEFNALVTSGAQILLVGSEHAADGEEIDAAVWISPDGRSWERVVDDKSVFGGPGSQSFRAVTWTRDGFVAVGHDNPLDTEQGRLAIWVSPDGRDWKRLPHDPDSFEALEDLEGLSVAVGPGGSVVVGRRGADGAVWYSPDTQRWELLTPMSEVFGGDNYQVVWDVLPVGEGFLAVGGTDPEAGAWVSVDGRSWRLIRDFGRGSIRSVTAMPGGFVGVGVENRSGVLRAAVWISPDGSSWYRIPHNEEIFGGAGNTLMYDVASSGNRVVAVGYGGIWVAQADE